MSAPEDEKKRRLEEARKRLRDLRQRIEKWAMVKIADVGEMNAVYREIGEVLRTLERLNPDPEAVRLKKEAEDLKRRVEEMMSAAGQTDIASIFDRAIGRSLRAWSEEDRRRVLELVRSVVSALRQGKLSPQEAYFQLIGIAYEYAVPLSPRDISQIRNALAGR